MIAARRAEDRGHADHGWLDARHTFSFASFLDPEHMGFRTLRVLNQDRIQASQGFGTHGHRDMEIVTVVLEGALQHRDSMGHGSIIRPGDVQYMSAGSGVTHSEFNALDAQVTELLQMWVLPAAEGLEPRYDQREYGAQGLADRLRLVVSPDGREDSIAIRQDASLYAGHLGPGVQAGVDLAPGRGAWLHVARGAVRVGELELSAGDGAAIEDVARVELTASAPSDVVLWDLA